MTCPSKILPSITTYPSTSFISPHCTLLLSDILQLISTFVLTWFVAKRLTTGFQQGGSSYVYICQFLWHNYPHHTADFQLPP